ncbi:hypothetical protein NVP1084O_156 [Vibrio phage 1.084.O._10N.261.49.F5]|nr:hypothetical protein NVP1084O_156 [Vibrio phage 1.084.O._10N.261.49.F5]
MAKINTGLITNILQNTFPDMELSKINKTVVQVKDFGDFQDALNWCKKDLSTPPDYEYKSFVLDFSRTW